MRNTHFLFLLAPVLLAGCSDGSLPYDSADAVCDVQFMTLDRYYDDSPVQVFADLNLWSASRHRRMNCPDGDYLFQYTLTGPQGDPIVCRETRHSRPDSLGIGLRGDLRYLSGVPHVLPCGNYTLAASISLPDGKVVCAESVRSFEIHKRELRVTLCAPKPAFVAGEPVIITAWVENLLDRPFDFSAATDREIRLKSRTDWDIMVLDNLAVPRSIAPGEAALLTCVRFHAGLPDARFAASCRREWTSAPFGRPGRYDLELSMKVFTESFDPANPARPRGYVEAAPASLALEIFAGNSRNIQDLLRLPPGRKSL